MLLGPEDVEGLQLVGSGGFGSVYRGWSRKLSMEIAVKMIEGSHCNMKSLMKEKEMMSRANYTYVLRLLGLYEREGIKLCKYGLVMEYMPYGTVCTLFSRIKDVPWALRFRILHQVALGMNYLHHVLEPPIIHRDLKRHNVLLNKSLDVQLTDFGLAKNEASVISSQSMAGTPSHMPPEALESLSYTPTKEFDVYSYSIFTWSVLSGHEPYENVNGDMIKMLIPHLQKHRPDMNLVNQWRVQKMVSEAIQLMQECWDAAPEKRPSFSAIIERTNEMNAAYACEIHNEVIKVLDQLENYNASHSQTSENRNCGRRSEPNSSIADSSTFNLSEFRDNLQQAKREGEDLSGTSEKSNLAMEASNKGNSPQINQEIEEPSSSDEGTKDVEQHNNNVAEDESSEDTDDADDITPDFVMNNIVTVIKQSGDYKKIMNKLDDDGILSRHQQEQLKSSQNLKDLGSIAGKAVLTKCKKNPEAVLGFFKKLF